MQERSRIRELLSDLKSAIHRLVAGIDIVRLDLLPESEIMSVDPRIRLSSRKVPYALECRTRGIGNVAIHANMFEFPAIRPGVGQVRLFSKPSVSWMPVIGCGGGTLNPVPFRFEQNPAIPVDFSVEKKLGEIREPVKIKIPEVKSPLEGISKKNVKLREVDIGGRPRTHRNMEVISRIPINIRPAPWDEMDKHFIIKCWELLRIRVREQLGHDPGKDLEMTAVYRDIDFTNVKRTVYDRNTREMKLYLHESPSRNEAKQPGYAIIIGLIKGTGKVVQVAMPV